VGRCRPLRGLWFNDDGRDRALTRTANTNSAAARLGVVPRGTQIASLPLLKHTFTPRGNLSSRRG